MPDYSVRALVVDDSFMIASVIAGFLKTIGFRDVEMANNGLKALEMLRSRPFELVVSDYVMGPISGPEMRRDMDADPDLREVPFLLLTTQPPSVPLAARYPDLWDFALKPFTVEVLRQKVYQLLEARSRRDALQVLSQL